MPKSPLSCRETCLRVRSGDCRGVVVFVPTLQAFAGAFVRVAGWGRHVVRQDAVTGELYLTNRKRKESNV